MSENNTFGSYFKNYREENNLTVRDLHRMTSVSQPYITQLECGKIPSKKIINKLSKGMAENEIVQAAI